MKSLARREFLKKAAMCAGCAAVPGIFPKIFMDSAYGQVAPGKVNTVLLVFLGGGPDTLHWCQPMGSPAAAALQAARPTLYTPDNTLLPLTIPGRGTYDHGFHPALTKTAAMFSQGKVAVVLGCGAQGKGTRDHDGETLRVQHGADSVSTMNSTGASTGVLSRAASKSGFTSPFNLFSYQGGSPATTDGGYLGIVTNGFNGYGLSNSVRNGTPGDNGQSADLMYACQGYYQAQSNLAQFTDWGYQWSGFKATATQVASLNNISAQGYTNTGFGRQIRNFHQSLVGLRGNNGRSLVRLAAVSVGGHDTHSGQLAANNTLLADIDSNIGTLFTNLTNLGNGDAQHVTVIAIGEFSRTPNENNTGSTAMAGTDHGWASTAFIYSDSSNLNSGLYGTMNLGQMQAAINSNAIATQFLTSDVWGAIFDKMGLPRDQILPTGHVYTNPGIFT